MINVYRIYVVIIFMVLAGCDAQKPSSENLSGQEKKSLSLLIYVGAASKPPVEKIVQQFQEETGINVQAIFGGSGFVLSQMKLSQKGDIYFPGSSDYMEIAKRENLVFPETEQQVVYLVNAINVQRGNPKNIQTLEDLCKPGVRVAIANPEGVCVGMYAIEIIEQQFNEEQKAQFRKNLVNYTESCDKTAMAVALKAVDAVIGWRVFEYWNPDQIESIPLKPEEITRIGYIPVAVSTLTENRPLAQRFIDYVISEKGKAIFKSYNYFSTSEEAMQYLGVEKPVGGEYEIPTDWLDQ